MNRSIYRLAFASSLLILGLGACASTRQWTATGGNKEAGLVRVSYQYSAVHKSEISESEAMKLAENRCEAWGYERARPVAGLVRECSEMDAGNCEVWKVTREFECSSGEGDVSAATRLSK